MDVPSLSRKITNSKFSPSLKSLETEASFESVTASNHQRTPSSMASTLPKLQKLSDKELLPAPMKKLSSIPSSIDINTIDNDLYGISATLKELPFDFALLTLYQLLQTGSAEYRYSLSKRLSDEIKAADILDHFPLSSKIPLEVFKMPYVKKNSPDVFESAGTSGEFNFNPKPCYS